jgi:hypothetical protein
MAVNKPVGDNARKGAVRKRSQIKTAIEGEEHWTKRSRSSGQFMDQKKDPEAKPFKGVEKSGDQPAARQIYGQPMGDNETEMVRLPMNIIS